MKVLQDIMGLPQKKLNHDFMGLLKSEQYRHRIEQKEKSCISLLPKFTDRNLFIHLTLVTEMEFFSKYFLPVTQLTLFFSDLHNNASLYFNAYIFS